MRGHTNVYWLADGAWERFPELDSDVTVDVAVIGGGIVGITTARRLKDLGLTVAVVEARTVGTEVTGRSTAKVTSQHRAIYSRLADKYDDAYAAAYGAAQEAGVRAIRELVAKHGLDCDLAAGRDNDLAELFDAGRLEPVAGGRKLVKESAKVVTHLAKGYFARRRKSFDDVLDGQAAIVHVDGADVAAYRDEQGAMHAVSAKCTHMECHVGWNEVDRTWDCPCRGSRFSLDGDVIHGPAVEPLARHST